ncbi:DUF4352 domain-containing protein [Clostridium chrysemydis]|uniref:DUF4352 domain-containing protein n=1 Tax=Clostridium chrysemydis TaxID=2665504 RepID=UPI0018834FDA|nr:DUF4352 domain-containing protein [Clostridium chrysemydis]
MKNKKQILIYVAIAVVSLFIGGLVSSRYYRGKISAMNAGFEKQLEDIRMSDGGPKVSNKEKSEENTSESSSVKTVKIGEEQKYSGADLKILSVKEANSVNNEAGNVKASGKFIIIELSLKNTSKDAIESNPHEFKLVANGAKYLVDDTAFEALQNLNSQKETYDENKNYVGPYDKFNPGITKKTYIVFEVPKEVNLKDSKLIVSDNEDIQFELTK